MKNNPFISLCITDIGGVSQKVTLTCNDTRFFTLFQGLKVVGVSTTASIFKVLTASRVDIKEESVLDSLAWSWLFLQGAQLIEDEKLRLCSMC